jgi:Methane oxygenase PmoA
MKHVILSAVLFALPLAAQVKITQGTDRILVDIDGKPFTAFFIGADNAKPYMHPLRTASGKIVTRSYPMETVEGEAKDHPHHRGLWFTHGDVNKLDFWGNEKSQKGSVSGGKGFVVTKKVVALKSGKKSGSLAVNFDWQDEKGKKLLTESRIVTFYSHSTERIMDFDIKLTAVEAVSFNDTKEGTFAIRLATSLEEKHSGKMTNAEGRQGEKQVWGKRSPWVDYAGTLDGEAVGIAILDHPANPRFPTYWHSRSYGLFAANPFGVRDFENDKSKDGKFEIAAGQTVRFRYRVIIHPGDNAAADIAGEFKKWSAVK